MDQGTGRIPPIERVDEKRQREVEKWLRSGYIRSKRVNDFPQSGKAQRKW
jgi:hypothetical protein